MVLGLAALGLVFFGWLARISPLLTALGAVLYSGTLWVAVGKPKSVTAFAQSMRASTFAASLGDEWQAIVVMSAGLRARWQALEEEWARRREEVRKRLEEQAEKDAKAARDAAAAAQELRDPAADAEACAQVLSLYESHCRYLKRLFKPKN
ncbi:hypothetical protein HY009_00820 [Candidatus Acetothermia bacterium]|nr:hypothetical protein [Candidatus Acetothermia bacterium]